MNLQQIKFTLLNKNQKYNIETKYIKWYFNIIENAVNENRTWYDGTKKHLKDYTYYERHHILPKSLFPEYKDFRDCEWNKAILTPKEHFIVHLLIWKHYKSIDYTYGEIKMSMAIRRIRCGFDFYNSILYTYYRLNLQHTKVTGEKLSKSLRKFYKNNISKNSYKIYIYDNNNNLIFTCNGNFSKFCKENNLPHGAFINSYKRNGERLYQLTNPKNKKYLKYKGWYALIDGDIQINNGYMSKNRINEYKESYKNRNYNLTESGRIKISISSRGRKKSIETINKFKKSIKNKHSKDKCYYAKKIIVFNSFNCFILYSNGEINNKLKEYNLPINVLIDSYRNNGKPIYKTNRASDISRLINNGNIKYKSWYAIDIYKLKFRINKV